MKKLLVFISLLILSESCYRALAQNLTPPVGIGTTSPDQPVTINASSGSNSVISFQQSGITKAYVGLGMDGVFRNETVSGTELQLRALGANNFITMNVNLVEMMRITSSRNIGIGTTNPLATLHVNANNQSSGDDAALFEKNRNGGALRYTFANVGGSTSDIGAGFWRGFHLAAPYITVNGSNTFPRLAIYSEYNSLTDPSTKKWVIHAGNSSVAHDIQFKSENTELMYLRSDGNIGIGTTNPQAKLAVNGDIFSKKVKVTQTGWSDYVFDEEYQLPTLEEIERYVRQHKHLPEIPSAREVEERGLDLGDTQALMLKKIEELTLYLIEQNRAMQQLMTENKNLKKEIDEIKKNIQK